MRLNVRNKLIDVENQVDFEVDMQALATTEMASDTLLTLLSCEPQYEDWEVGESLAQCLLEAEYGIHWPWNQERDKRTPRASLPGVDLVGFGRFNHEVWLVFGEVKTSNDQKILLAL
ncbi:MAG: hypothetical protein ACLFVO_18155 [Chloroflexaceae bacterium]